MNNTSIPVVGLGAGGHAKSVIEIVRSDKRYRLIGLLDADKNLCGAMIMGVAVLGADDLLPELKGRGVEHFFIGLGGVSTLKPRRRLFEMALSCGLRPIQVVHPEACVSPSATIGSGITIMAKAVVNAEVELGENVLLNTGAVVEHDCRIGSHVHIATGALLAGGVVVGHETFVGMGAAVRQEIRIGSRSLVGAGAVVVKDVPDDTVVIGNPARPWR